MALLSGNARAWDAQGGPLSPEEVQQFLVEQPKTVVVDLRTSREFSLGHLEGAINIPVKELETRHGEIPAGVPLILYCGLGYRSINASKLLRHKRPDIPAIYFIEGRPLFPK
ncbi:rhodanese-like domain-containing protein [Megalodesulfovibrio paquesii]